MMFIAKPEHIEQVLKTQFENFPKSQHIHDVLFDLLGEGIKYVMQLRKIFEDAVASKEPIDAYGLHARRVRRDRLRH
ncbi:hypothetical protein PR002_g19640 [Phytophthora rubi]|uniref:Uncharacterized protein n=1 Tax=Phytophthora rubi TaxID=129364 RepID=A0A6A3JJR0_9STRA|nr:hypothetical protein PR002_g19640 [Phytophthora rubi]